MIDSRLELGRRLGKRGGNLRFTWAYTDIDRDHYEVAAGVTDTRTNVLGVAWNNRIAKKLRLDVRLSPLGLNIVYTLSQAGLDPLALAAPEWVATHPAQSYDFSGTHTYSDQDLAQLEVGLDARYRINQKFWVDARYRHAKLDDDDPYIVDISGDLNAFTLAVGHQF